MAEEFYYGSDGRQYPLSRSTRSLAIAYRTEPREKDLEGLIRGDARLWKFIISPELSKRRIVLFRRSAEAVGELEEFAERVRRSADVDYVSAVFYRGGSPVVITDEFVAAFKPETTALDIRTLNSQSRVEILRQIEYMQNTFVLKVLRPDGLAGALPVANRYAESSLTITAEPNFIEVIEPAFVPNDPLYPSQWHLPQVHSEEAWNITRGDPSVIVAVVDEGCDIDHEDLATAGKITAPRDIHDGDDDPRPALVTESHGTAVSGVAVADGNNAIGMSGIAPACRLMPIRLLGPAASALLAADSIVWAVDHGAAVINNSYRFTPPFPLPVEIGGALAHAVAVGRGGLGAVVVFAAGNDNLDNSNPASFQGIQNDPRVIAVSAVNDQRVRSGYSNFGAEIDVCAPTNGSTSAGIAPPFPADGSVQNVFTLDRMGGPGYNTANAAPSPPAPPEPVANVNYTGTFGGTSSAAPLVSGIAALMLSVRSGLTRDQVEFILEATADKVDFTNADPVGQYQPNGHSQWYGFGSTNAFEAVKGARSSVPERDFVHSVQVVLRRTSGDRFVATKVIHAIDARQRQDETLTDIFIRGGPDGFLRAETAGAFDEVEVDA